jgi:hypothetical protein
MLDYINSYRCTFSTEIEINGDRIRLNECTDTSHISWCGFLINIHTLEVSNNNNNNNNRNANDDIN